MRIQIVKIILGGLFFCGQLALAATPGTDIEIIVGGRHSKFNLKDLQAKLKAHVVSIDDPVYKTKKSFDAFLLGDVLRLAGLKPQATNDEIVFTASDGYAPTTSFKALNQHKAFLAFQETGTQQTFAQISQGKTLLTPAPYYVVWDEGKAIENQVPWPYQLVKIEVVNFAKTYDKLYPHSAVTDSTPMKGFAIFKQDCLRCHSINLQGGDIGPELNSPKNITEYWQRDTLKSFIRNSESFRYKSKMPAFTSLSDTDIENVLSYFDYMKDHKISQ